MSTPIAGDFSQIPFPLLLVELHAKRASGCLEAQEGTARKRVYLLDGTVVFAASNRHNDRLGEMLLRRGVLRLPEYLRAVALLTPGKRFGTILVELGLLAPQQLIWAVKEQVKEIAFSLFPLQGGSFLLTEGTSARDEVIQLNINTPELIRQGIERMDRIDWILEGFGDTMTRFVLTVPPSAVGEALALSPYQKTMVELLQSPNRILDLLGSREETDAQHLKFLWSLYVLNLIAVAAAPEAAPAEPGDISPDDFGICVDDLKDMGV